MKDKAIITNIADPELGVVIFKFDLSFILENNIIIESSESCCVIKDKFCFLYFTKNGNLNIKNIEKEFSFQYLEVDAGHVSNGGFGGLAGKMRDKSFTIKNNALIEIIVATTAGSFSSVSIK